MIVCCSCKSLSSISEENEPNSPPKSCLRHPKMPSLQVPTSPRLVSPKMENLTNAVEFLGGKIDVFNKIVCKFRKRMEDFEKAMHGILLKEENSELRESILSLHRRLEMLEAEKFSEHTGLSKVDLPAFGCSETAEESPSTEEFITSGLPARCDFVMQSLSTRDAFFIPDLPKMADPVNICIPTPGNVIVPGLPPGFSLPRTYCSSGEVDNMKVKFSLPKITPEASLNKIVPKNTQKRFDNILVRLMAEEYLAGKI